MEQCVCLNIHYSAPKEVWNKINKIYRTMPYWNDKENYPCWRFGDNIDLAASVEPSGIQISGIMPKDIWNKWYDTLKKRLSEALEYEIGDPEEGFKFKYWEPFEKKYSDIKTIDNKAIIFTDYSTFYLDEFDCIESHITEKSPFFVLKSSFIELNIYIDKMLSKRKREQIFLDFKKRINS